MTTAIKERPIIMGPESINAILAGRKTATRRVIKPQPETYTLPDGRQMTRWEVPHFKCDVLYFNPPWWTCPYGQPGDRLWVREKWRVGAWDEDKGCVALDYSDGYCRREWLDVPDPTGDGQYFNDLWIACTEEAIAAGVTEDEDGQFHWEPGQSPCSWRPSVFMPRWASRITLEVVGVMAERLQEITIDDLIAEGWDVRNSEPWLGGTAGADARAWYAALWDRLNPQYPWASNPWVWVVEFRRAS